MGYWDAEGGKMGSNGCGEQIIVTVKKSAVANSDTLQNYRVTKFQAGLISNSEVSLLRSIY